MYPVMILPVHFHILILINRQGLPVIVYTALQHPVYLHASLSSNHKDLLVTTTTCVHAHRSAGSLTYRFILFHSNKPFVLTCPLTCCSKYSQIYLSSINRFHLCVFCFPPGFTCTLICQLICWTAYRQTHRKINVPVNFDAFGYNHEDLPADSTVYMSIDKPVQKLSPFIFKHPFQFTSTIHPSIQPLLYVYTDLPGNKSPFLS